MNIWMRRLFLVISIGGGVTGFTAVSAQILRPDQPISLYVIGGLFIVGYAVGVYGGLMLIEREIKGLTILSWYFLAQVPLFVSPVVSYQFTSGLLLSISVGTTGFHWGFFYGSRWMFYFFDLKNPALILGINFFAVWATWYLRRHLTRALTPPPLITSPETPPLLAPGPDVIS